MVEFSEGLRAPKVGERVNYSQPQVNPGRAAAAIGAAAVIGASGGSAYAQAQNMAGVNYQATGTPTRTALPSAVTTANPFLQGLQGAKAPALGSVMPSVPQALSSASGGLPPKISGMGASGLGMAIPALLAAGAEVAFKSDAFKQSPLGKFLEPINKDIEQGQQRLNASGDFAKAFYGNLFNDLKDKLADRFKNQRKGDTFPRKIKPDPRPPFLGTPGAAYDVEITQSFEGRPPASATFRQVAPLQGLIADSSDPNVTIYRFFGKEAGRVYKQNDKSGTPTIANIKRIDGMLEAALPLPDWQPQATDGLPSGNGLLGTPTTPTTPVLPGTAQKNPTPLATKPLPPVSPTTPAKSSAERANEKQPSNPAKTTPDHKGDSPSSPALPSVGNPLSAPSPALPGIPSAPSTGSASTMAASFPSAFTEVPGKRNDETLKQKEPTKPEQPKKKPNCEDPCITDLQNEAEKNKPVDIVVKVFKSCKISGGTTSAPSTPTTPTTPASGTTTPASGTTTTTTGSGGGVTSTVSTGTISNPTISDGVNKPTKSDGTPPFESQTVQEGNALFETRSIKVPGQEAANYKLLYERIAKLEAQHCDGLADGAGQAIASVPEWWQLRAEAQRPQLVIIFSEVFATGKLGKSCWSLTIPHYNKPKGFKPKIPAYEKGNFQGVLTLTDNSKLIVNAKSMTECKRVLNSLKLFVPASYRTRNGKGIKPKVGELPDAGFKVCRVTPSRADFYKTGARNLTPDWSIDFKAKA